MINVRWEAALASIEHLDFEFEQPCEHSLHAGWHADEPAMFEVAVKANCGACAGECGYRYFLCLSGWERLGRSPVQCPLCYAEIGERDDVLRIVRVVGGPR